jgi:eukaryotic-like serine/threonine-protein kinase
VPLKMRRLIGTCLQKDSKHRLQAIGDWQLLLENVVPAQAKSSVWPWVGALALVTTAVLALIFVHFREKQSEAAVVRFTIPPPEKSVFVLGGTSQNGPAVVSPDGRRLAFNAWSPDGTVQIWVRSLDMLTARPLAGTEGATHAFWSPDGQFLGFFADGKLKRIDASGGPPLTICQVSSGQLGGTWNRDGVIVFSPALSGPLHKVSATGGASIPVTSLDQARQESAHRWPWFLPDGRHFLYLAVAGGHSSIRVGSLDAHESKIVGESQFNAIYSQGYLIYLRETALMAQPFDAKRLVTTADAIPLAQQIQTLNAVLRGVFSVSENGFLVYSTGAPLRVQLAWVDRSGKQMAPLGDPGNIGSLALSPDQKQLAATVIDPETRNADIWIYDVARGIKTRFTFDAADDQAAAWSPDGHSVVFASNRRGHYDLFQKQTNGLGNEELLYANDLDKNAALSWSTDGRFLLYHSFGDAKTGYDLWILPMAAEQPAGERKPFPFAKTAFREAYGQFSPDARWIAYESDESQRNEIYVAPFPGPGRKLQISRAGGSQPRWRQDGKEIFFISPANQLMAAEVSRKGDALEVGAVKTLFVLEPVGTGYPYDVAADGERFIIRTHLKDSTTQSLTVVQNWTELLKSK